MENEEKLRQELYSKRRDELLKRQLSNSENADRAILTISIAALGFSLAFLKDLVPLRDAQFLILLYASWIAFTCAILVTLASFFSSQAAINGELIRAEKYYLEKDQSQFDRRLIEERITVSLNWVAAISFVAGVVLTCIFSGINLA
ncbi:hypothetical protein ICN32_10565 [Polynucleobacter wuianus]|uniref:hypothetical protein n=1 Tax=Polynucleobacter wuianus TaxID=1743168 RepID=UPI001C0B1FAA|nr:hypothetical protein [Polynucleobacter wuianus]MBU3610995.1 hypothetical protein [Polynucleobacter wuianus]